MPFDFLNTTTIEPQLEQQQQLMDMLTARAVAAQQQGPQEDDNDPRNLQEISDDDMGDLVGIDDNEHEELSDEDAEKMATDRHDFQNEDMDSTDYELMNYLLGDGDSGGGQAPKMQYGGGTLANAGTVYSDNTSWLKDRVNNIKFQFLNRNPVSKYTPDLPNQAPQNPIQKNAEDFVKNDPMAKNLGISMARAGGAYSADYQYGGMKGSRIPNRQYGGKTLFAETESTLRQGLNNDNYNKAVLKLSGMNTIRGLDNNQPVAVTDGSKYRVLHGPKDTDTFNGKVYEKRL
jgi:hypothetical protein